ncbi:MAG TPA: DUF4921 family protein [Thermoanaerobaculia bacterium]|nr:DUF4921 family protein [Thermoanaerobaculia bacterium]
MIHSRGVIREHILTGQPLLFAPERAERPHAFSDSERADDAANCPFCPGNEKATPPELAHIGEPWRARAFPNKYPPIDGAEVIVESNRHGDSFDTIERPDDAVALCFDRYRAHGHAAHVALFKNHGSRAGASIPHVHSQLVPLPFVPPRIALEAEGFARAKECPLCQPVARDLIIDENESFVWFAPLSSTMPYQQWIVPKVHANEVSNADGLAPLLVRASRAMLTLGDSYNWLFQNFRGAPKAHWYIELFPRVTTLAGLELSTGTFVEIVDPTAAAQRLK